LEGVEEAAAVRTIGGGEGEGDWKTRADDPGEEAALFMLDTFFTAIAARVGIALFTPLPEFTAAAVASAEGTAA
jgi:hypothetical protein